MSSSDHLHPQQLQMFMPAGELRREVYPLDSVAYGTRRHVPGDPEVIEETFAGALSLSKYVPEWKKERGDKSLYDQIAAEGVKKPVRLTTEEGGQFVPEGYNLALLDGHHRVSSAADINPTMEVPVIHE